VTIGDKKVSHALGNDGKIADARNPLTPISRASSVSCRCSRARIT